MALKPDIFKRIFVQTARQKGIAFRPIAEYLDISRERVHQLSGEKVSKTDRKRALKRTGGLCEYCGEPATNVVSGFKNDLHERPSLFVLCDLHKKEVIQMKTKLAAERQREYYDALINTELRQIASNIKRSLGEVSGREDTSDLA